MAADTRNLPSYLSGDADFTTWVQGIQAQIALMSAVVVQTTDTGQIASENSVARPGAGLVAGYEVYRFTDTHQAARPIFFKIEYGTGTSADRPALWFTVGTASDGAGGITGTVIAPRVQRASQASDAVTSTRPSYCSAAAGRFALVTTYWGTTSLGLLIERPRLADYTSTAEGVYVCSWAAASGTVGALNSVGTLLANLLPSSPFSPTWANWETVKGTDVAMKPGVCAFAGKARLLTQLQYSNVDLPNGTAVAVGDVMGATRTYLPLGTLAPTTGNAGNQLAIPFD